MSDYTVGDTLFFAFTTRSFTTGAPTVLAGTPVVSAYEDTGLTQITAGITLGVDHDAVVGLNMLTIVATGANGFESGKDYHLVITTGTVGGVSVVGEVVARFTLGRSAAAVDLANVTDGLGAIKTDTAAILVDTGTTLDGRIPAALVGGRIDSSVGAMAADTITASAVAVGAIAADAFVAGAIDAAAIAADAIGSSELAATAVAEIADGVWDEARSGHLTLGTYGESFGIIITGSAIAGTLTTTTMTTDLTEATDDHYNGRTIIWTSGVLLGQASNITDYTGLTKLVTYTAVTEAPTAGDDFIIV